MKKWNMGAYGRSSSYSARGNVKGRGWMFRLSPTSNKIEFAEKYWHSYYLYQTPNYFLTFGAGMWKRGNINRACV